MLQRTARHRILIVDDNAAIRESLADALADEGYTVDVASDGATALNSVGCQAPAVILLDLSMPGIDGVTVARQLAKSGSAPPVIVVSADRGVAERARAMGAAGFLTKPFDLGALVDLIEKVAQATSPALA
jgi:two-component system response regulator MprA